MRRSVATLSAAALVLLATATAGSQSIRFIGQPELVEPGLISTKASEIRNTFSPDGKLMLWGAIDWQGGAGGLCDIWQSVAEDDGWSQPQPVSFNSTDKDFDPFFAPDGSGVYFFSDRPGTIGGADIYFVPYDATTGVYGEPSNLGAPINTKGDECGPSVSPDGRTLLYCSDGHGGAGKQDIVFCERTEQGWGPPRLLPGISSPQNDYDPLVLPDGETIIFSRETGEDEVLLHLTHWRDGVCTPPQLLDEVVNPKGVWSIGAVTNPAEPSVLYFTSFIPGNTLGPADLYRIRYRLEP